MNDDDIPYQTIDPTLQSGRKAAKGRPKTAPKPKKSEWIGKYDNVAPVSSSQLSNSVKCVALLAHTHGHMEILADVTAALSRLSTESPADIPILVSAIGSIAKAIARDAPFDPEEVAAAYALGPEELERSSHKKPVSQQQLVFYGNLVNYCKSVEGVVITAEGSNTKISHKKISIVGELTEYGAIRWSPNPRKFVTEISGGRVGYATTGTLLADFLIFSYCMHHRISRSGVREGEVKVSVEPRKFSGGVDLCASFDVKDALWKSVKCLRDIYKEFDKKIKNKIMATWAGDPTPHFINQIGDLAIRIAKTTERKLVDAVHALTEKLRTFIPKLRLDTKMILGDQNAYTYALNHPTAGIKTAAKMVDATTAYKGGKTDTAHTTLSSYPSMSWWLGPTIARRWRTTIQAYAGKLPDHAIVKYIGNDDPATIEFLKSVYPRFHVCRVPLVKGKPQWEQLDIGKADLLLCDYEAPPPSEITKGSTAFTAMCNAQASPVKSILARIKTTVQNVVIRCFPLCKDTVSFAHLESATLSLRETMTHFGFLPGGDGDRMEVMFQLSKQMVGNTFPWAKLSFSSDQLWSLLATYICSYAVDLNAYTCEALRLGVVFAGPADALLIKGIVATMQLPLLDDTEEAKKTLVLHDIVEGESVSTDYVDSSYTFLPFKQANEDELFEDEEEEEYTEEEEESDEEEEEENEEELSEEEEAQPSPPPKSAAKQSKLLLKQRAPVNEQSLPEKRVPAAPKKEARTLSGTANIAKQQRPKTTRLLPSSDLQ